METILITGANSTFAKKFYETIKDKKLKVILLDKVKSNFYKNRHVDFFKINLENLKSTEVLIKKILRKYKKINHLVTYASYRSKKKKN